MIANQNRTKQFVAAGGTVAVSLGFPFADADDLRVTSQSGNGDPVPLLPGVHYSIVGSRAQFRAGTGAIKPIAIAAGLIVSITRHTNLFQRFHGENGVPLSFAALNESLDDSVMRAQDNAAQIDELSLAVAGKADEDHGHPISDIAGLSAALDSKSDKGHRHDNATQAADGFMASTDKKRLDGAAPIANPNFTGAPLAPTPADDDDSKRLATTEYARRVFAPLISPSLMGVPSAPTAPTETNNTQLATTAFVKAAIGLLIQSAPEAVDTIYELAASLNNDPNFANTMIAALAGKSDIGHGHVMDDIVGLIAALASKSDNGHRHNNATQSVDGFLSAADKIRLDSAAPIANPNFTGSPKAPTAASGTNTTQIANTAFVMQAIANLVGSSPEAVDTIYELAAALGNDPNFATTMLTALAGKAALIHGHAIADVTGLPAALDARLLTTAVATKAEAEAGTNSSKYMTPQRVAEAIAALANAGGSEGGAMATEAEALAGASNALYMSPIRVKQVIDARAVLLTSVSAAAVAGTIAQRDAAGCLYVAAPTADSHAATKKYVDDGLNLKAPIANPNFTGSPKAPTAAAGTNSTQIANTAFVMQAIANLVGSSPEAIDTIYELAAALGNDPNFATTVAAQIGSKADAAHGHAIATTVVAGFMSALDKVKLNNIAENANNYSHPTVDGSRHVPATAAANVNKFLKSAAAAGGAAIWVALAIADIGGLEAALNGKLANNGGSFSGGYNGAVGSVLSGTPITPALAGGHMQSYTAPAGAWTINPPAAAGNYNIEILVTNPAGGAGSVAALGFTSSDTKAYKPDANARYFFFISVRGNNKFLNVTKAGDG